MISPALPVDGEVRIVNRIIGRQKRIYYFQELDLKINGPNRSPAWIFTKAVLCSQVTFITIKH